MYEVTVTFTRNDTEEDFFAFSLHDKDLLYSHARFRNEVLNAEGFMSLTFAVSDDKLTMKVITLWESSMLAARFFSLNKFGRPFDRQLKKYLGRNAIGRSVTAINLPDSAQLKAKKLSSRLTLEESSAELKEFLTKNREPKLKGEHAVFLTDDVIDLNADDEDYDDSSQ
jgi:heme-degrading monooxygenase HmoA